MSKTTPAKPTYEDLLARVARLEQQQSLERARLLALMNSLPEDVFFVDAEGQVVLRNEPAGSRLGMSAQDEANRQAAVVESMGEVVTAGGRRRLPSESSLLSALRGEAAHGEELFRNVATGELRSRRYDVLPVRCEGKVVEVIALVREIAEPTGADEHLRQGEERFGALTETSPDIVTRYDRELRLVHADPWVHGRSSRQADAFIGRQALEYGTTPALASAWQQVAGRVLETGEPQHLEYTSFSQGLQRTYDAVVVPERSPDGAVVSFIGIARDITESKRAEELARQAHQNFVEAVESLQDGFLALDRDWRFTYINRRAAINVGLDPEDLVGRNMWEMFPSLAGTEQENAYRRAMSERVPVTLEVAGTLTPKWYRLGINPTTNGLAAIWTDVTEHRQAEAALREREQRARRVIGHQVARLSSVVNDLLDIARITRNKIHLHKERLDLNEVVRRAVEDNRSLFERCDSRVHLAPAAGPVLVTADRTRVAQVLDNILHNSAKFTLEGGCARVSVTVEENAAVVRVADDGLGMGAETVAGLFQPFMQTEQTLDRSKGGLGLGLALVKGLVELHGGSVWAHSEGLGRGSEFVVRFPRDSSVTLESGATGTQNLTTRRRVLIIEDNVDAADSLREALEFSAHEVVTSHNGPEGLAKARMFRPDVVLCDIGLPDMNGFEVARAFRTDDRLKGAFLVALSGYALPEDLQHAASAGFQHHLAKPTRIERIEQILAGAPARDRPDGRECEP